MRFDPNPAYRTVADRRLSMRNDLPAHPPTASPAACDRPRNCRVSVDVPDEAGFSVAVWQMADRSWVGNGGGV